MSKIKLKDPELPPFVKTWKQFYLLLMAWLCLLVVFFYFFTQYFK